MAFLPVNYKDMINQGITCPDFVYVIGDAYIDHSSFGPAIISRTLSLFGYTVCILSQPDINNLKEFTQFGKPRLGFLVSSGNIDSMVNHYTVAKKRRKKDAYTPDGVMGKRPDRAVTVYSKIIKKLYPDSPVIIGGIEASLRRLAHYDYWMDKIVPSVLLSSNADLLLYGMGERVIVEVADALNSGMDIKDIIFINGTVYKTKNTDYLPYNGIYLPSYKEVLSDKRKYAEGYMTLYNNQDPYTAKPLIEKYDDEYVVQNIPQMPLSKEEMDVTYSLPYEGKPHPMYEGKEIPALKEVEFSITMNRGCYGNCNFCALNMHQGRIVSSRSKESIIDEAKNLTLKDNFKGYIHDVGGPTANFYNRACDKQDKYGVCTNKSCLAPNPCKNLKVDHSDYLSILKELRKLDKVKRVFIRSGIRYDYLMLDKNDEFFHELVKNHVSGQLRVAPEHISKNVLLMMNKPANETYDKFVNKFYDITKKYQLDQYIVPYLMSSHPGSTMKDAVMLAEYLRDHKLNPDQVQDFYPTPLTISTVMYYTGLDPRTMKEVYVPKDPHEKAMQRALLQYKNPKNYDLVYEALHVAGRVDLIGNSPKCLIKDKYRK